MFSMLVLSTAAQAQALVSTRNADGSRVEKQEPSLPEILQRSDLVVVATKGSAGSSSSLVPDSISATGAVIESGRTYWTNFRVEQVLRGDLTSNTIRAFVQSPALEGQQVVLFLSQHATGIYRQSDPLTLLCDPNSQLVVARPPKAMEYAAVGLDGQLIRHGPVDAGNIDLSSLDHMPSWAEYVSLIPTNGAAAPVPGAQAFDEASQTLRDLDTPQVQE
ncbi:MAG: hypothetical protein R3F61_25135 [Myxococcota bacterium]